MTLRSTLLIQPYGGAIIDPRAKVYFLNETATDMARAMVDGCTVPQAAERIAATYEISIDQVETDIMEFLAYSDVGPLLNDATQQIWSVIGSESTTSIVEADICLTNRCNLGCTYCYAEAKTSGNGDLTAEEWTEAARSLVRLGMKKATIAGGEPTLSEALFPLLDVLAANHVTIQLFTNGLLVKPSTVERLQGIPLNFVQVSLDSTRAEDHNRYRGASHASALRAINLLADSGMQVVIGANIFPDTLDEVARLAEFAESLGATLRCNPIEARGRGASFDEAATVVNELFAASLARTIEEVSARRPWVFAEQEVRQALEASERVCPFAKGCVAVTASAEIRPCSQTDTFFRSVAPWAIDHRKAWEYAYTIQEHVAFRTIAQIQPEVCPTRETCAGCTKYPICAGCLLAGYTCEERR